jgi:hypothetical protein
MPMYRETIEKIKELLSHCNKLIAVKNSENMAPYDYTSLLELVVHSELEEEVSWLTEALAAADDESKETDLKNQFKARCADRAARNSNSCLAFTAMPQGACNKLYWEMANLLFT